MTHRFSFARRMMMGTALAITVALPLTGCMATSVAGNGEITIAEQSKAGMTTGMIPRLAEHLGYFADEGLTVNEYVTVTKGADALSGMVSGSVDVAHIGPEGVMAAANGGDVIGLGAMTDANIWTTVAAPDIKSWSDLKGKTVALGATSDITKAMFDELARSAGLDPDKDVEVVALGATPQRLAAVQNNQAAATIIAYPTAHSIEANGKMTILGFGTEDGEVPEMATTEITADSRWAEANPDEAVGYLTAIRRTVDYLKDPQNNEEIIPVIAQMTGHDPVAVERGLEVYFQDPPAEGVYYPDNFRHAPGAFDATVQAYVDMKLLTEPVAEDEYMDYSYADQVKEKK